MLVFMLSFGACSSNSDSGRTDATLDADQTESPEADLLSEIDARQASGRSSGWTVVAPTNIARESSTVIMLADGRVLVASGHRLQPRTTNLDPALPEDSAEVYDPSTDTWKLTPTMGSGHFGGSAAVLSDGRVLLAGGWPQSEEHDVELFDPKTWSWSAGTPMTRRRQGFSLVKLLDGGLLAAGGIDWATKPGEILGVVERYGHDTETWTRLPDLTTPRVGVVLPWANGKWIFVGAGSSTEIYDPATRTWSPGPVLTPRLLAATVLLRDGRIMRSGGFPDDEFAVRLASADILDPETGVNAPTGTMTEPRSLHTMTELPNGRVLAVGSAADGIDASSQSAEVWDPLTEVWTVIEPMNHARHNHAAIPILNGTEVLIVGGYSDMPHFQALRHCEVYRP